MRGNEAAVNKPDLKQVSPPEIDNKFLMSARDDRFDELQCIYRIAKTLVGDDHLDKTLQAVVDQLPSAFKNPRLTYVAMSVDRKIYESAKLQNDSTSWSAPILVEDIQIGFIEAALCRHDNIDIGETFSEEEVRLLKEVADLIGERLQRENIRRGYQFTSQINEALFCADDELTAYNAVCEALAKQGRYVLAWIGLKQESGKEVAPVAIAGNHKGYVFNSTFRWDDSEFGRGPTGIAIKSGLPQINRDFANNPSVMPWRDAALAAGFRSHVSIPLICHDEPIGALMIYADRPHAFGPNEMQFLLRASYSLGTRLDYIRARKSEEDHAEKIETAMESIIRSISSTFELRDPYTAGHQRRVAQLATAIGRELLLPKETIKAIDLAAQIHDIGKVNIPSDILTFPGRLDEIEKSLVRTHVEKGYKVIKGIDLPWPIADAIHQHHERMDGSGYPNGLIGDEISREGRIIGVADVVESMATHRPYRPALGMECAIAEISAGRGALYDPMVVDACLKLIHRDDFDFV